MKPRPPLHWLIAASLALPAADYTLVAKAATPAHLADKGASRVAEQTQRGDRLALVIGNKDYASAPLQNPVNDARDIKAALEQVGFRVIYRENATKMKIVEAVREFKSGLGPDSVGVVYFSGHGAQADGENYLIPVGADIRSKAELQEFAYNARMILGEMEDAGNRVDILILDACRNNPFKGFRGGADGLAMMSGPKGSLIAYATAPGSVAADGASGNSHNGAYTGYLKQYLTQPGLTVEQLFKKVRQNVIAQNPQQVPWENSSITGEFCFAGCEGGSTQTELPPAAPVANPQQQETAFWNGVRDSDNPVDFEEYLKEYPEGQYVNLARNNIKRLRRQYSHEELEALKIFEKM
ncbi:MAG: caspase domain-containing protein [Candidatus Methylumidiphilus sp.]